jgi:hypothetical protein
MRLYGIQVRDDDLRTLIRLLARFGRAKDLDLAGKIGYSIANGKPMLPLSTEERDAILGVLDDPPAGLVELRKNSPSVTVSAEVPSATCGLKRGRTG